LEHEAQERIHLECEVVGKEMGEVRREEVVVVVVGGVIIVVIVVVIVVVVGAGRG